MYGDLLRICTEICYELYGDLATHCSEICYASYPVTTDNVKFAGEAGHPKIDPDLPASEDSEKDCVSDVTAM